MREENTEGGQGGGEVNRVREGIEREMNGRKVNRGKGE